MNRQSVHRYFRQSGKLLISEHQGSLWASDAYVIVPCDQTGPIAALLSWWNLPVEPGSFFVEDRVRPNPEAKPPDLSAFLTRKSTPMEPVSLLGSTEWTYGSTTGQTGKVYSTATGALVLLDDEKRRVVEALSGYGKWHGDEPAGPATYVNDDGVVAGVAMPIRHSLHGVVDMAKAAA